jgi:serine phosphatase RsbU (regulator of sigma subunit)
VLYTDGVTEAQRDDDAQWGEERLIAAVREENGTCAGLLARIVREVRAFEGGRGASDDVTLVIARRTRA